MIVYALWEISEDYERDEQLRAIFKTREAAEAAVPGARWVDGHAMHPIYDIPWESNRWYQPYVAEEEVLERVESEVDVPRGPTFGPPSPPPCRYQTLDDGGPKMCVLFKDHEGDHELRHGSFTSSFSILTPEAFTAIASDGTSTQVAL